MVSVMPIYDYLLYLLCQNASELVHVLIGVQFAVYSSTCHSVYTLRLKLAQDNMHRVVNSCAKLKLLVWHIRACQNCCFQVTLMNIETEGGTIGADHIHIQGSLTCTLSQKASFSYTIIIAIFQAHLPFAAVSRSHYCPFNDLTLFMFCTFSSKALNAISMGSAQG